MKFLRLIKIAFHPSLVQKPLPGFILAASLLAGLSIASSQPGYTVTHTFGSLNEPGYQPNTSLLKASDGKLYGVTPSGGNKGRGVIFRLNTDGTGYEQLHQFIWNFDPPGDGAQPRASLTEGSGGV